jgi:hypothetical protein
MAAWRHSSTCHPQRTQMGNTMTSPDLAVEDVIDVLDSFYCHNRVVAPVGRRGG